MKKHNFQLKENTDFIPLNNLLQTMHLAQSGGHAKILILQGEVKINGVIATEIRKKIRNKDIVEYDGHIITISAHVG